MEKITSKKLTEILQITSRTLKRNLKDGLPVADKKMPETGGSPQNFYILEDVKNWFLEFKPTSRTARFISDSCPPGTKKKRQRKSIQKKVAKPAPKKPTPPKKEPEPDPVPEWTPPAFTPDPEASGSSPQAQRKRLAQAESQAYDVWMSYLQFPGHLAQKAAMYQKSYLAAQTRLKAYDKDFPKIMYEWGKYGDLEEIDRILNTAFLAVVGQFDQLGYKMSDILAGKTPLEIKSLIDSEISKIRKKLVEDMKGMING